MAERVVKVRLSAVVDDYKRSMAEAAQATQTAGNAAEKLTQQRQAFQLLGTSMMAAGGLMAAGLGVAVAKAADFNQAMSYVAATGDDARESFDGLREAAIEAGASTVFSATESANAIEEMAKAGVDAKDILGGGLKGALDLAAAGGLGVADAAGIAATALKVFNLEGSDMGHVADLLAAGAGKAMGDVSDLSAALAQGGQVAAATGLTIEETTATLAAFASQGLLGSDAGTSFKTMLQRLTPQSAEARDKMRELGISAYDASGQFIGMAEFAGNLQGALEDLTPEQRNAALSVMFGSDAVRAANVLLKEGESGIRGWISAVDDQGYAAETAATRLDNLKGDIEQLGGALDTMFITMGDGATGPLRFFTQALTGVVDGFSELPDWGQQTVFWIGAVTAGVALSGGAFLVAVPKIAEYRAALQTMGATAQTTARVVSTAMKGLAIVGAIAVSVELAKVWHDQLQPSAEELANALGTAKTAQDLFNASTVAWSPFDIRPAVSGIEDFHKAIDIANTEASGFFGWLGANTTFDPGNKVFGTFREGWQNLAKEMANAPQTIGPAFRKIREEYKATDAELMRMIELSPELKAALTEQATAAGQSATPQNLLALALRDTADAGEESSEMSAENVAALKELQGQASDTGEDIEDLADQIRNFGSATLDTRDAQRQFEQALDDVQASIDDNGTSLDITEEKGRANEAALDDLATSALEYSAALLQQTGDQDAAAAAIQNGRDRLIELLGQFGITGQAAEDYADQLGLIPGNIPTIISANFDPATATIQDFMSRYGRLSGQVIYRSNLDDLNGQVSGSGRMGTFAGGGPVYGPGGPTDDRVPAMLSNGEHVLTAQEVQAAGGHGAISAWRASITGGKNAGDWQSGSQIAGGSSRQSLAPAAIYVQNPFTGEYLLAKTASVAGAAVSAFARSEETKWSGGGKSL